MQEIDIMTKKQDFKEIKKLRKVYAIYDRKKVAYLGLMEKENNAVAIRDFQLIVNSERGIIKQFPEDYKLVKLGTFDEEKGTLTSEISDVCEAIEVINKD